MHPTIPNLLSTLMNVSDEVAVSSMKDLSTSLCYLLFPLVNRIAVKPADRRKIFADYHVIRLDAAHYQKWTNTIQSVGIEVSKDAALVYQYGLNQIFERCIK